MMVTSQCSTRAGLSLFDLFYQIGSPTYGVPTVLTFEAFDTYSKTHKPRHARERVHDRGTYPLPFHKGANEDGVPFYKSTVRNFIVYQHRIQNDLLQLFVHTETSKRFSIISCYIFEVNTVATQKEA